MKRLVGLGLVVLLSGCRGKLPTDPPAKAGPSPLPRIQSVFNATAASKIVLQRTCWGCHDRSPYPAGVEIHPGSPWTVTASSAALIRDAICDNRAPAGQVLTGGERDTLAYWIDHDLGGGFTSCCVPETFHWSMTDHIANLTIPGDGAQTHGFFGFNLETLGPRPTLYLEDYHDNYHNWTKDCLKISQYNATPYDSFQTSDDPVVYVVPDGVPWTGNIREFDASGYFRSDIRFFFAFHIQKVRRGPTNTTRRQSREEVRVNIESDDGWMGIRGSQFGQSKASADREEVQDWYNGADDPMLSDESSGPARIISGMGSTNLYERFFWMHVTANESGGYTHYYAEIWGSHNGVWQRLGQIAAKRSSTNAYGGFMWGYYQRNGAGNADWIAEWEVDASSMQGFNPSCDTACDDCEIDRQSP